MKKEVLDDVKAGVVKQITGNKDTTNKDSSLQNTKQKATETLKNPR